MARFLLIGLDGGEPSLVESWMAEGHLPHLAALRDRGTFMPLASTRPPVTFPAWTTCVTGVNPGRHGIFDFTEMKPGEYGIRFVNRSHRTAPALWNMLDAAGKRPCVLGVPGTYPPEPLNGVMVSGFDSPVTTGVDRSFVYPPERYPAVRNWRFADFQEHSIGPGWHDTALKKLLAGIEAKTRMAEVLLREEPWDFFMMVYGESDTVSHHFWLFHDKNSPRHRPGFEDAILRVYKKLDCAVGKLVEAAGPDTVVGIVSDHGFGGAGTGVVHLNNWLADQGYLHWNKDGRESLIKKAALALTPESWRGSLFRRFEDLAAKAESQARFGRIDWSKSTAWSEELNYFPSIRLNLAGREPDGQVRPEDYDAFVAELCAKLESWKHIAQAWPRAALFDGPEVTRAPDITLELALEDGYAHSCLRSAPGGAAFRRVRDDERLGGNRCYRNSIWHVAWSKSRSIKNRFNSTDILYYDRFFSWNYDANGWRN
ncbi:MAG: alkaline phosphatase family protein [Candidatus Hydrogenedentes bacterium]|nr:alkaline phosphatase family protein [Candidatus Hydrogenedentota bacterium]